MFFYYKNIKIASIVGMVFQFFLSIRYGDGGEIA